MQASSFGNYIAELGLTNSFVQQSPFAYLWAWMEKTALDQLKTQPSDSAFYEAKIKTAQFYFKKILPRAQMHVEVINGGLDVLMRHKEEEFIF
ncbi:acyl-CoA dehydrogenase C-terminal domain-containing protein [Acinetobacter sp.]|uniref:acyl-CoA dehydrogenase C-terminal domain-containing protein n=1 Tax=Acinetobacter sp. TaxID=472 RepID=UPI0035AE7EDA